MDRASIVREELDAGFNCAESIVAGFVNAIGAPREAVLKAATPFGAGIGRTGYVCGLVSGGAIVLGLAFGRTDPADEATKERAYEHIAVLIREVKRSTGSILCFDILGANLADPEGRRRALAVDLFRSRCRPVAVEVVGILERLLGSSTPTGRGQR